MIDRVGMYFTHSFGNTAPTPWTWAIGIAAIKAWFQHVLTNASFGSLIWQVFLVFLTNWTEDGMDRYLIPMQRTKNHDPTKWHKQNAPKISKNCSKIPWGSNSLDQVLLEMCHTFLTQGGRSESRWAPMGFPRGPEKLITNSKMFSSWFQMIFQWSSTLKSIYLNLSIYLLYLMTSHYRDSYYIEFIEYISHSVYISLHPIISHKIAYFRRSHPIKGTASPATRLRDSASKACLLASPWNFSKNRGTSRRNERWEFTGESFES